jgi:hypothetical protein
MTNQSPWDFNNEHPSPDNTQKLVYQDVREIAMGAPLGGKCFLVNTEGTFLINSFSAGPPIWETDGVMVIIPLWSDSFFKGRMQQVSVLNTIKMELKIYSKLFNVMDISLFHEGILYGNDSPISNPKKIEFNTHNEKVKHVIKL